MTTEGTGGVEGDEDCGGTVVGDGSEGVSRMGSTERAAKRFEGWGEGVVGAEGVSGMGSTGRAVKRFEGWGEGAVDTGEVGRVEGVAGLEGPGHFWIICPGCLHRKQSLFLVQRSRSSGVKGAR